MPFLFKSATLTYLIKNNQGEVVASKSTSRKESIGYNKETGTYIMSDAFLPFDKQQNLTLKATSLTYEQPIDYSLEVKPLELETEQVKKELIDGVVTVKKAYLHEDLYGFLNSKKEFPKNSNGGVILIGGQNSEDENTKEQGVVIELDHIVPKDALLTNQNWKVKDEQGNIHQPAIIYYTTTEQNGENVGHYFLGMKELKQIPNDLSLILDETVIREGNLNWTVPLTK